MKNLKKIKLSNIKDSQLEKEQLVQLKGGADKPKTCGTKCTEDGCAGVSNYFEVAQTHKS